MSLVYARGNKPVAFLGSHCFDNEIKTDETGRPEKSWCRDTNPGSLHIVAGNLLGMQGRSFIEDKTATVSALTLRDSAKSSRWTVAGISIGASLAAVQKANGKPFVVSGFGWDYGGFVTDLKNGALGRRLPGGCSITLRFGKDKDAPRALSGDGVKVSSDNPALLKFAPVVTEIGVNFAAK